METTNQPLFDEGAQCRQATKHEQCLDLQEGEWRCMCGKVSISRRALDNHIRNKTSKAAKERRTKGRKEKRKREKEQSRLFRLANSADSRNTAERIAALLEEHKFKEIYSTDAAFSTLVAQVVRESSEKTADGGDAVAIAHDLHKHNKRKIMELVEDNIIQQTTQRQPALSPEQLECLKKLVYFECIQTCSMNVRAIELKVYKLVYSALKTF